MQFLFWQVHRTFASQLSCILYYYLTPLSWCVTIALVNEQTGSLLVGQSPAGKKG